MHLIRDDFQESRSQWYLATGVIAVGSALTIGFAAFGCCDCLRAAGLGASKDRPLVIDYFVLVLFPLISLFSLVAFLAGLCTLRRRCNAAWLASVAR